MEIRFVGSGDAFGSGGRFQTCIRLRADGATALVDCGATSLTAMKSLGRPTMLDRLADAEHLAAHDGLVLEQIL